MLVHQPTTAFVGGGRRSKRKTKETPLRKVALHFGKSRCHNSQSGD